MGPRTYRSHVTVGLLYLSFRNQQSNGHRDFILGLPEYLGNRDNGSTCANSSYRLERWRRSFE